MKSLTIGLYMSSQESYHRNNQGFDYGLYSEESDSSREDIRVYMLGSPEILDCERSWSQVKEVVINLLRLTRDQANHREDHTREKGVLGTDTRGEFIVYRLHPETLPYLPPIVTTKTEFWRYLAVREETMHNEYMFMVVRVHSQKLLEWVQKVITM